MTTPESNPRKINDLKFILQSHEGTIANLKSELDKVRQENVNLTLERDAARKALEDRDLMHAEEVKGYKVEMARLQAKLEVAKAALERVANIKQFSHDVREQIAVDLARQALAKIGGGE